MRRLSTLTQSWIRCLIEATLTWNLSDRGNGYDVIGVSDGADTESDDDRVDNDDRDDLVWQP
jgi:hypothetical protein